MAGGTRGFHRSTGVLRTGAYLQVLRFDAPSVNTYPTAACSDYHGVGVATMIHSVTTNISPDGPHHGRVSGHGFPVHRNRPI